MHSSPWEVCQEVQRDPQGYKLRGASTSTTVIQGVLAGAVDPERALFPAGPRGEWLAGHCRLDSMFFPVPCNLQSVERQVHQAESKLWVLRLGCC